MSIEFIHGEIIIKDYDLAKIFDQMLDHYNIKHYKTMKNDSYSYFFKCEDIEKSLDCFYESKMFYEKLIRFHLLHQK